MIGIFKRWAQNRRDRKMFEAFFAIMTAEDSDCFVCEENSDQCICGEDTGADCD